MVEGRREGGWVSHGASGLFHQGEMDASDMHGKRGGTYAGRERGWEGGRGGGEDVLPCSYPRIRGVDCLGHAHVGCVNAAGFVLHGCWLGWFGGLGAV